MRGGREKVIDEGGGEEIRRERGMGRGMGEGRKENCGFLIFSLSLVAKRRHVLHNMGSVLQHAIQLKGQNACLIAIC